MLRSKLAEQVNRGSRHAAVIDVADDRDLQALERFLVAQNRVGIEQRLRGMLVHAIAGIDDRNIQMGRHQQRRAGVRDGESR